MATGEDPDGSEERRADPRELAVLRVAKLVTDRGEQLCRIRNISAGGVMVEVPGFYFQGERAAIELKSGGTAGGRVAWVDDGRLGIAFDEPVDPDSVLAIDPEQPPRALRFVVAVEASLCFGRVFRRVTVEDISLGGVRVRLAEEAAIGEKVFVAIEGLPNLPATIRWQSGGYAGIAFEQPLTLDALAFWLAERR
jgi:hypothetical protein